MAIRHIEEYTRAIWDWGWLDPCFAPTRIRVSDIDGVVERGGHVLFLEAKGIRPSGELVELTTGQKILHKRLLATGCISIIVLWGRSNNQLHEQHRLVPGVTYCAIMGTPDPCFAHITWEPDFATTRPAASYRGPVAIDQVRRAVRAWFQWSDTHRLAE